MYMANHYVGLHNVVVSVALAVAGTAAASFLGATDAYRPYLPLLWLMLITSLLAIAVAFAGTVTGAPVLPSRLPAMLDLILPLVLGMAEFFLFGILSHQITGVTSPQAVTEAWFVASAGFGVSAALSIARARSVVMRGDYNDDIKQTIDEYTDRLVFDIVGASATAVIGIVAFILERLNRGQVMWFSYMFVGLMIACFCIGFGSHATTRKKFETALHSCSGTDD